MKPAASQADVKATSEAHPAMAEMMRAGVYRGRGAVRLEQVPVPKISDEEVLIQIAACGICGTDIKKIEYGFLPPPLILGHEIAGTIAATGRGVSRWKTGDRVISFHHIPCGACFFCERRLFSQCATYKKVGVTAGFQPSGGGFAEYVRVMPWIAERGLVAIPTGISFEEATFVEPVNTCLKAVQKARVAGGESVVVIGQGPIGLLLMMLSCLQSADVMTTDPIPERRERSLHFGATLALDPTSTDVLAAVRNWTGGRGADAVLLAVPNPALVSEALGLARPGGRVLLFAHNDPVMRIEFPAAAVGVEEKEILGSYSAAVDLQGESAELVFKRRLPVRELVSHRFSLDEIERALGVASRPAGDSLKVVILP